MPKRTDIKSILIIGAGPIVIGQACEFDYSGAQACKALREEGYRVVLVNSNPATIMTDPAMADAIYIEPIQWQVVEKIIEREKPDAILPTMGGQTALNCALDLEREGVLERNGMTMIGATSEAIDMAEDRDRFRQAMTDIGLDTPRAHIAHSLEEARQGVSLIGFPCIIRPSFTMGGSGGGIAYNQEEFESIITRGLHLSPTTEVLLEESVLGWKEYEMEVVRDNKDNVIIICSIENFDPMGVHTGDSITVAPAQTLTDKEYQLMRNASIEVLRKIGVDTGGSNVQFAINPENGAMIVIEMNPRVSRSSALASKATGFPIAKVAAKLAVGYTLDELQNEITGGATPASFEPALDYVVTKIPRFTFEKYPAANDRLTTQMKSVGEVMAIGRTFQESLQKALRGLETGINGLDEILPTDLARVEREDCLQRELREPGSERIRYVADAFRCGWSLADVFDVSKIDPWFLSQLQELVEMERQFASTVSSASSGNDLTLADGEMRKLKRKGFSDDRLAQVAGLAKEVVRQARLSAGVRPVYKRVDSCAAEFASSTAYLYSTYEEECEAAPSDRKKIIVLGGGPNRIGQGIEFDYCCVHAALALKDHGFETIMVNCNPETVSTDYDTSDRLYFEPLTFEDVMAVVELEQPMGVIVHYGGQTPLKLAQQLEAAGVPIIGTSPESIDLAEDRERFQQLLQRLKLRQPPNATVRSVDEALQKAGEIGYPLVVRPSYVLGGRAMEIVRDESSLQRYMVEAVSVSNDSPVLLDEFLDDAVEVDVDLVCDGEQVVIAGIMEHIEEAGVHSGDSACCLPPYSLSKSMQDEIRRQVSLLAMELGVVGLMNAQFAVQGDEIFVLEVNPRASRTIPFVSKACGIAFAKVGALSMAGVSLAEQGVTAEKVPGYFNVKESVFPFIKFPGVDPLLGPEMKSTGEVMGVGKTFGEAFGKATLATNVILPAGGTAFLSVRERDREGLVEVARQLLELGFKLVATPGTTASLTAAGITCDKVNKLQHGRPNILDSLKNKEIDFIVNTTDGSKAVSDSYYIRMEALSGNVAYATTLASARAICRALAEAGNEDVYSLQHLHQEMA